MTELTITKNDAGQRVDRFLSKAFPNLTPPLVCKLMRKKRIKLNGAKAEPSAKLAEGDVLRFYLSDELLSRDKPQRENDFRSVPPDIDAVYEDENILLVNKPAGMVVHEDSDNTADTLINRILCYLWKKGEYRPEEENSFVPALCNRIDRNTCGIVIAAKNAEALRVMNQKVRDRELVKLYLCVVCGTPSPRAGELVSYIKKLPDENRVLVSDVRAPDYLTACTKYRVLESRGELSLVEADLLTGRTHQIRAQFAHVGSPLLGDGKYGSNRVNRQYGCRYQALCSYKLTFRFTTPAGCLEYLNGKSCEVSNVGELWFMRVFRGEA